MCLKKFGFIFYWPHSFGLISLWLVLSLSAICNKAAKMGKNLKYIIRCTGQTNSFPHHLLFCFCVVFVCFYFIRKSAALPSGLLLVCVCHVLEFHQILF